MCAHRRRMQRRGLRAGAAYAHILAALVSLLMRRFSPRGFAPRLSTKLARASGSVFPHRQTLNEVVVRSTFVHDARRFTCPTVVGAERLSVKRFPGTLVDRRRPAHTACPSPCCPLELCAVGRCTLPNGTYSSRSTKRSSIDCADAFGRDGVMGGRALAAARLLRQTHLLRALRCSGCSGLTDKCDSRCPQLKSA